MEDLIKKLRRVGPTQYEAKVYLCLLSEHLNTATKLSEKSGVPRTKIYSVLESLEKKGWIQVYSGIPLLFRALDPRDVFEKLKRGYDDFLKSVETTLVVEGRKMKERFVIMKYDMGLKNLKDEMRKAKTIWITNATTDFLEKVSSAFNEDAEVKVLMFPGEKKVHGENVQCKMAAVEIVSLVGNREVPSTSIVLDESRVFTVFEDPVKHRYTINEMLYDECARCFVDWYSLGWNATGEVGGE